MPSNQLVDTPGIGNTGGSDDAAGDVAWVVSDSVRDAPSDGG